MIYAARYVLKSPFVPSPYSLPPSSFFAVHPVVKTVQSLITLSSTIIQTVFVTGGSGGLGKAISKLLIARGSFVQLSIQVSC